MSEINNYKEIYSEKGCLIIELSHWETFDDVIHKLLDTDQVIYRGQRDSNWNLDSCLDRRLLKFPKERHPSIRTQHLKDFKLAVRGRRGHPPCEIVDDDDWWALGQHHGLPTPLLDWTESPYVALFFAFEKTDSPEVKFRSVYALQADLVDLRTGYIEARHRLDNIGKPSMLEHLISGKQKEPVGGFREDVPPTVPIIRPMTDENARLTSQRGLFTRLPDGITLEYWVKSNFGIESEPILIEFRIPNIEPDNCLRNLNRMNINRLSLFPDIDGAAAYCNTKLMIDKY